MKTIYVKPADLQHKWYVLDATNVPLGKLAVKAATLLQGKHKPYFTPHQPVGDFVVVINAGKVALTGRKGEQKTYYRHTGYPGGIRSETFDSIIVRKPVFPVEHAIKGMLPKNKLGRKLFTRLKVYAGSDHPHAAQQPEQITV
jgi:large subunit ribosomal protein L13